MAIGAIAELANVLGSNGFAGSVGLVLPRLLDAMKTTHYRLHRNAAFCMGALIQHNPLACQAAMGPLLASLQPVFAVPRGTESDADAAIDNAASTLCRAIMAYPSSIPLAGALPVVLNALPLRVDHDEDAPVYGTLLWLLATKRAPEAAAHAGRIVSVSLAALAPGSNVPPAVQQSIAAALRGYHGLLATSTEAERGAVQAAVAALPAEVQAGYARIVQGWKACAHGKGVFK
jgi:hypothetical protein